MRASAPHPARIRHPACIQPAGHAAFHALVPECEQILPDSDDRRGWREVLTPLEGAPPWQWRYALRDDGSIQLAADAPAPPQEPRRRESAPVASSA